MLIPYGIQSYARADLPQIKLSNLYVEKAPTLPNQEALLPRPGLGLYASRGTGPARGIYYDPGALNSALFLLSGTSLYGGATNIGTVPGTSRVSMAATLNYLLIGTGSALYGSNGTTVAAITFPDGAGVTSVGFLGGYAFAARTGSRRIYFTLDPTTWDGIDYISAEQKNGNIVGFAVVAGQIWVFCDDRTEIFTLTGDATAPIQQVQGRLFDKGALTRDSIVTMDNTVVWVGHDGIVYRGESTPTRISDHGIEELISESMTANITAWAYPWMGHLFYVLNTTGGTRAYDPATQQWHEVESYGRPRWRASMGVLYGRDVIAADDGSGNLWKLTNDLLSDNGDPLERWFSVIINKAGFIDSIAVDCSTGQTGDVNAAPGIMEMRSSRDSGQSFVPWRQAGLGANGNGRARAVFRRCGMVDQGNMLMQFRVADPRPSRISYIRLNDGLGGRSR